MLSDLNDLVEPSTSTALKIPAAKFIDHVEDFIGNKSPELYLHKTQQLLSKYKFMEDRINSQLSNLLIKIPEIIDAITTVKFLKNKLDNSKKNPDQAKNSLTYYKLSETLFAQANIPSNCDSVFLWLGANVMLEYPLDEAETLLTTNLSVANENIARTKEDMAWLGKQITTTEVNLARIHNYIVKLKQATKKKNENNENE